MVGINEHTQVNTTLEIGFEPDDRVIMINQDDFVELMADLVKHEEFISDVTNKITHLSQWENFAARRYFNGSY